MIKIRTPQGTASVYHGVWKSNSKKLANYLNRQAKRIELTPEKGSPDWYLAGYAVKDLGGSILTPPDDSPSIEPDGSLRVY